MGNKFETKRNINFTRSPVDKRNPQWRLEGKAYFIVLLIPKYICLILRIKRKTDSGLIGTKLWIRITQKTARK